jgi:hypothetical protein
MVAFPFDDITSKTLGRTGLSPFHKAILRNLPPHTSNPKLGNRTSSSLINIFSVSQKRMGTASTSATTSRYLHQQQFQFQKPLPCQLPFNLLWTSRKMLIINELDVRF